MNCKLNLFSRSCYEKGLSALSIYFNLSSVLPQVRLRPDDLLLLLPNDGAQVGQQRVLVTPGVLRHAVIQAGQLVQQRLLAPRTRQQLLLRLAVTLQLGPDRHRDEISHDKHIKMGRPFIVW